MKTIELADLDEMELHSARNWTEKLYRGKSDVFA